MGKTFKATVDWLGMVENGGSLPGQDEDPSVNGEIAQTGIEFEAPKRDGERINSGGSESTHIMKTETIDGINWVSFPTLFQNKDGSWDNTYELMLEEDPDNWKPAMLEAKRRGELIHFGPNKEDALKYGEGSWKAQTGTELSMCSNGEWNGGSVKTACGNRNSAHNLYGSTGITIGDISDKSLSGSLRGGLGYSTHVPYSPMTGHVGLSAGTRFTGDEESIMFNPTFDATGSVGIEGEFGGNSHNWREPWKYGAGIYGKQDLVNGTGTTAGLYGNVGNFSGKVGYNTNTGAEATIGFGLPIRQEGGERERFINFLKDNEGGAEYIRNKNSVTKKIVDDEEWDGESYHKIFDEDSQKHYAHIVGDEKAGTIGYGHHNKDVLKNFPNGITETKALEMLGEDADAALSNTEIWWNSKYKSGDWEKLDESTQYMLADIGYNVGHIREFPKFANAINTGDFELAEAQYKRYDNDIELGRNVPFMEEYLKPWMDVQKEKIAVPPSFDDMPLPIGVNPIDGTLDTSDPFEKLDDLEESKYGGQLPKAQDGKEVNDYFTSYLNSDLFKRRAIDLHGEEEWEKVRDAKLNALNNTKVEWTDAERLVELRDIADNKENLNIFDLQSMIKEGKSLQSKFSVGPNNPDGVIRLNQGEADLAEIDDNLSFNPMSSIIANEYSHALGSVPKELPMQTYPMTKEEKKLTNDRQSDFMWSETKLPMHDLRSYEVKSDIDTTRFELWKAGLYDFEEEFMFDESHMDYIRNNPDKFMKSDVLLEQYDNDDMLEMMNTFTSNDEMPIGMSKYGGQHNWALDRRPISNAQRGKEIKSDDVYSNDRYSSNASKYKTMLPKYQSEGAWNDFEKSSVGKFVNAKGLRQDGEHFMNTVGDYFGYDEDEGKDLALDATAIINPAADFIHAGTKFDEEEYTDAALYAGLGILPFAAGPLVKGVKNKIINPIKDAVERVSAKRFGLWNNAGQSTTHTYNPKTKSWIENNAPKVQEKLLKNDIEYLAKQDYITNKITKLQQGKIKITEEIKQFKINNPGKLIPKDLSKVDDVINRQLDSYSDILNNVPPTYTDLKQGDGSFGLDFDMDKPKWIGPTMKSGNDDIMKGLNAELKKAEKFDLDRIMGDYKWDNRNILSKYFDTPKHPFNADPDALKPFWLNYKDGGSLPMAQDGTETSYGQKLADSGMDLIEKGFNSTRPSMGVYENITEFFGGTDCHKDRTCVQAVRDIYENAGFESGIPQEIYDNESFSENYKDYGYELVPTSDRQPGDLLQYYYKNGAVDRKFHMGIYVGDNNYVGDGSPNDPMSINNIYEYSDGTTKEPFNVYRKTELPNKQKGGEK